MHTHVFVLFSLFYIGSFLTMIPLASILGDFTEEAATHTNEVIGGLVSTLVNGIELLIEWQVALCTDGQGNMFA